jgi:hypothetical protein
MLILLNIKIIINNYAYNLNVYRINIYRNSLKNRECDKEASQNFHLERVTIVRAQGTSEDENFEKEPTPSKTDSSGCFGI